MWPRGQPDLVPVVPHRHCQPPVRSAQWHGHLLTSLGVRTSGYPRWIDCVAERDLRTGLVERPRRWEALYILERIGSYREAAWAIEGAAASARAITHRRGVNSPKCHLIDSVGQPTRRTGTWAYPATFDM